MLVQLRTDKVRLKLLHALFSQGWLLVSFAVLQAPSTLGQSESPLSGTVARKDGRPIGGVSVYGTRACCPFKQEETTTDKEGRFRVVQPGAVLHFFKDDFQPQAFVVKPGTSEISIILEPPTDKMVVPICGKLTRGQNRYGWGKYGFRFDVPKREVKILGGKPDVDYVEYLIQPRTSESSLELWFGPYAMNPDPDDELFVKSLDFTQRNIVDSSGTRRGTDSWGDLQSGGKWRWTVVGLEGARYRSASPKDATLFDKIFNSVCEMPYPKQ